MPKKSAISTGNNNSYLESLKIIKENPLLFSTQILITGTYIIFALTVIFIFSTNAINNLLPIFNYIDSIPVDDPTSVLGTDPLMIASNIKNVKLALISLGFYSILIAYVFGIINWGLTKIMLKKEDTIIHFIISYSIIFISYIIPFMLFFYYTLKIAIQSALNNISTPWFNLLSWIILIIMLYFYYISISLTTNSKLNEIIPKTLKNAKNVRLTIPIFLLSLFLMIISYSLIIYFIDKNVILMGILILFLFAKISYSRILYASSFK